MKRPPLLMHLRVRNDEKDTDFGLWLPLFLLLPLALVVFIILSPLILIAVLVLWPSGWGAWAVRLLETAYSTLCSIRGLQLDFENHNNRIYISVV